MKRFIKNNRILVAVLGTTLVFSLGILLWATLKYVQMFDYMRQTRNMISEVERLNKKKPAPVPGNVPLLEEDITFYTGLSDKLLVYFNDPLLPAQQKFIEVLHPPKPEVDEEAEDAEALKAEDAEKDVEQDSGDESEAGEKAPAAPEKIDMMQFKDELNTIWTSEGSLSDREIAYREYKSRFDNWDEAVAAFVETAQPRRAGVNGLSEVDIARAAILEPVTPDNVDEIFLSAWGVTRTMQSRSEYYLLYLERMCNALQRMVRDRNVQFDNEQCGYFSLSPSELGLAGTEAEEVVGKTYSMAAVNMEIIGDIVKRMLDSGMTSFVSFQRRSLNPNTEEGSFAVFHYSIGYIGTIDSARKVVEALDRAYLDSRVYRVKSVFFYRLEDTVRSMMEKNNKLGSLVNPGGSILGSGGAKTGSRAGRGGVRAGFNPRDYVNAKAVALKHLSSEERTMVEALIEQDKRDAELRQPYNLRSGYGDVLVGENDLCLIHIDVEYITENRFETE